VDSRLAADQVARDILEKLALLERTAGVRAHYRILDPLPLHSTDVSALQTAARMIGDWIGLRNAMFHISVGDAAGVAPGLSRGSDQEDFNVQLPKEAVANPTHAMAALAQEVSHAYLIKGNITAGLHSPGPVSGRAFLDITAIFLGLGKLILNGCVGSDARRDPLKALPPCHLSPLYLAFTHRATCSMRGLDYEQHLVGLSPAAVEILHTWDSHRDTVFSLALRNVLTAQQPHLPLLDAISDNHTALARFDQLLRHSQANFIQRLQVEMATYHRQCEEAASRLATPEQETYDPCMVYLNQVRRRMDLQRLADALQQQQDAVVERLQVLLRGIHSLEDHGLLHQEDPSLVPFPVAACPFDETSVAIPAGQQEARVQCPTCGYQFIASADAPVISNARAGVATTEAGNLTTIAETGRKGASKPVSSVLRDQRIVGPRKSGSATSGLLVCGFVLLSLGWLPLIGYVIYGSYKGFETLPYADILGKAGLGASALALVLIVLGIMSWFINLGRNRSAAPPPAEAAALGAAQPES